MKMRLVQTRLRSAFMLAAVVVAQGCQGCPPVTLKTLDLNPKSEATGTSGIRGSRGYCLSAGNPPPSSFSAGAGQIMVGFDNFFKSGSGPFPCDDVRAVVFRSGVLFDVSQFDSIVAADLLMDTQVSILRGGGSTIGKAPGTSFATTLGDGIKAFSTTMPDDTEVSIAGLSSPIDLGVSGQVRDWISNVHPNFGFVIGGPTGLVDSSNPPENNDAQLSWYGNIRLRVVYNPAQNPRAPQ